MSEKKTIFATDIKTKRIMARPIKETPILTGADAERFVNKMQQVENLSKETRKANRQKLMSVFETAMKRITICL